MKTNTKKLLGGTFLALSLALGISAYAATSVPDITSPVNGAILTSAQFVKVDWTDATGGTAPYEYQYESFSDATYTTSLFVSGWLNVSEISTVGTAEGDYYFRVRARDAGLVTSGWSNGAGDVHKITVDNTPTNVAPVLDTITSPVTIPELTLFTFDANATDMNFGTTLSYNMTGAPTGATLNSSTGVFAWTPSEAQGPGTYTFGIRASDGTLGDGQSVTINVTEVADTGDHPTTKSDCINNGWKEYSDPTFRSQKACEKYVRDHQNQNGGTPDEKKDCKNGGWKSFTNPKFKNQGKCVSFVNHLNKENKERKDRDDNKNEKNVADSISELQGLLEDDFSDAEIDNLEESIQDILDTLGPNAEFEVKLKSDGTIEIEFDMDNDNDDEDDDD
jgi:Putative Ig domain